MPKYDNRLAPRPWRRALRRRAGHSLLEVMIAALLLSMATICFGALYPVSAKSSKMNGNYAQATSIAQHKVDQLRSIGYGRLVYNEMNNAGIIDASPGADPYEFDVVDGLANYFPSYTGTITFADEATDLKRATVTVSWTGQGDKATAGEVKLVALIARE